MVDEDEADWLGPAERIELKRDQEIGRTLHRWYPNDEYPVVSNEQDAWLQLYQEMRAHREHGGLPPDIFELFVDQLQDAGGLLPLVLGADSYAIVQPTGGTRVSVESDGAIDHMVFEDLDAAEMADFAATVTPKSIHRLVLSLVQHNPDFSLQECMAMVIAQSDLELSDIIERGLESGRDPDEYVAQFIKALDATDRTVSQGAVDELADRAES